MSPGKFQNLKNFHSNFNREIDKGLAKVQYLKLDILYRISIRNSKK